jgi:hypothetical protein
VPETNPSRAYGGIVTTGVQAARLHGPGGKALSKHTLQVKGVGAAPTSWSVTLEGSLDDANWTVLATHAATDGSIVSVVDKPVLHLRVNVGALSLGSATAITVIAASAE